MVGVGGCVCIAPSINMVDLFTLSCSINICCFFYQINLLIHEVFKDDDGQFPIDIPLSFIFEGQLVNP